MTDIKQFSLEERVDALESALKAQDTVHKMDLRAIAKALRAVLDVGAEQYPCEYSIGLANLEISKVENK